MSTTLELLHGQPVADIAGSRVMFLQTLGPWQTGLNGVLLRRRFRPPGCHSDLPGETRPPGAARGEVPSSAQRASVVDWQNIRGDGRLVYGHRSGSESGSREYRRFQKIWVTKSPPKRRSRQQIRTRSTHSQHPSEACRFLPGSALASEHGQTVHRA